MKSAPATKKSTSRAKATSATPSKTAATRAKPLKVAVAGASGRMGRVLIEAVKGSGDCTLSAELDIGCDPLALLRGCDVLIDFTRPEGTMAHLAACETLGVKAVIGTTGFDEAQKARIAKHAQKIAIVMAPNMSVGVNVVMHLLQVATKALNDGYDIEIVEAHHRHKVDAPSGTALKMGEVIAQALGTTLAERAVYAREGLTGERRAGSIGFSTIRGGDIIGDHTVMYCGVGERIEISHKSASRSGYAQGSLRAARFLAAKTSGLYGMDQVLGITP